MKQIVNRFFCYLLNKVSLYFDFVNLKKHVLKAFASCLDLPISTQSHDTNRSTKRTSVPTRLYTRDCDYRMFRRLAA